MILRLIGLCGLLSLFILHSMDAQIDTFSIHEGWQFRQGTSTEWNNAIVPGTVQEDLLRLNLMRHPFYGTNEDSITWVEKADWVYETTFELDQGQLEKMNQILAFKGLDTYASVYLNDTQILQADNMHRQWEVDVKALLSQVNTLKIIFHSPIKVGARYMNKLPCQLPAENDSGDVKVMPVVRKAAFHFGWDWGPRIVTIGIWRPIELLSFDGPRISSLRYIDFDMAPDASVATAKAEVGLSQESFERETQVKLTCSDMTGQIIYENTIEGQYPLTSIQFDIENPQLWWPRGHGDQPLYQLNVSLLYRGEICSEKSLTIGLRKTELIREPDSIGTSFYFKVNGQPIFAKGANYIPQSHFINSLTDNDYRRVLGDAVRGNMNMIRVWGGGIYEEDIFYDLCDSLGIMVWQDMMFANTMFPVDEKFVNNMMKEVEDNVMRLHHHPSIIHWCGNNEIEVAWYNWSWQKKFNMPKSYQKELKDQYDEVFMHKIPNLISTIVPNPNFTHTSPLSNWGKIENFDHHSMHYWGVFHGEDPFEDYAVNVGRFNSEYGFQSFPNIKLIQKYFNPSNFDLKDRLLSHRQKSYKGNRLIYKHIDDYYTTPHDMLSLSYISQLTQAKGISYAIQSHRIQADRCMGTLFWQLNDCWPAISWSSVDVDGTWRALQYAVRDAYEEKTIFIETTDRDYTLYVINDTPDEFNAIWKMTVYKNHEVIFSKEGIVNLPSYSNLHYDLTPLKEQLNDGEYMKIELVNDHEQISKTHLLIKPRKLNLSDAKIDMEWEAIPEGLKLKLSSDHFVKNLYLYTSSEGFMDDNFFDLYPNETKEVIIRTKDEPNHFFRTLKHYSLNRMLKENPD